MNLSTTSSTALNPYAYLIFYVLCVAAVDIIAIIGDRRLYYFIACTLTLLFWIVVTSVLSKWRTFVFIHVFVFSLSLIIILSDFELFRTIFQNKWRAFALILIPLIICSNIIIANTHSSNYLSLTVSVLFMLGLLVSTLNLFDNFFSTYGSNAYPSFLDDSLNIIFVGLAGFVFLGGCFARATSKVKWPDFYLPRENRQFSESNKPVEIFIQQIEIILEVTIAIVDFIIRRIVIWIFDCVWTWLKEFLKAGLQLLIECINDVWNILRFSIFQVLLSIFSALGLYVFCMQLVDYVYFSGSTLLFVGSICLTIMISTITYIAGIVLYTGSMSEIRKILNRYVNYLQRFIPHFIFILLVAFWTLIFMSFQFDIRDFTAGFFTWLLSTSLIFGVLIVLVQRRINIGAS